ncbi:unnamed protein product [Heterobilharzia americana]|nr:unnamed protein product [Heterobilharzia americana]
MWLFVYSVEVYCFVYETTPHIDRYMDACHIYAWILVDNITKERTTTKHQPIIVYIILRMCGHTSRFQDRVKLPFMNNYLLHSFCGAALLIQTSMKDIAMLAIENCSLKSDSIWISET